MRRVLLVSRNPTMAMGLTSTDYEVQELRPSQFDRWLDEEAHERAVDALVLDLKDPAVAFNAVARLRAAALLAPVLLVSSDVPGWNNERMRHLPAAAVLPLPLSRPTLLSALGELLASPPDSEPAHIADQDLPILTADAKAPADDDGLPTSMSTPRLQVADVLDVPEAAELEGAADEEIDRILHVGGPLDTLERSAQAPPAAASTPRPPEPLRALPAREPVKPVKPTWPPLGRLAPPERRDPVRLPELPRMGTTTARDRRDPPPVARAPVLLPSPEPPRDRASTFAGDPVLLVRRLLEVVDGLYGVPETAEVVVDDAVERAGAEAAALLLPDEGRWRVAAGVGLRPLEYRAQLADTAWLVRQVGIGTHGLLIEDSDIARQPLAGAPLASWRHLLAAPITRVEGILLVARRADPPFDETNLADLARAGEEAGTLLAAALDARRLARAMDLLRDNAED